MPAVKGKDRSLRVPGQLGLQRDLILQKKGGGWTDRLPPSPFKPTHACFASPVCDPQINTSTWGQQTPNPCFSFPSYKGQDHCGHLFLGVPKHLKVQEGMFPLILASLLQCVSSLGPRVAEAAQAVRQRPSSLTPSTF